MPSMMKMLSIVDRAMSSWLKEFLMSGFERIMILKPLPSNPKTPATTKVISGTYIQEPQRMNDQNFSPPQELCTKYVHQK